MSAWLILVVTLLYFFTSVDLAFHEKPAMAFMYFAYALANIGLYFMAKGYQ
jgi:hypothetical protein